MNESKLKNLFIEHSEEFCLKWRNILTKTMKWKIKNQMLEIPNIISFQKELVFLPFLSFTNTEISKKISISEVRKPYQYRVVNKELSSRAYKSSASENCDLSEFFDSHTSVTMRIELNEELWENTFSSNVRRKIRKAKKNNFNINSGYDVEIIKRFYNLYTKSMKYHGMPVYPIELLMGIDKNLLDISIFIISKNNVDLAGLITITDGDLTWVPWAATNKKELSDYCNYLLYWEAIKVVKAKGAKLFDFGRCQYNSSSYQFKKQFGSYHVALETLGNKKNNIYSFYKPMQIIWKYLPIRITNLLNKKICYYLSDL